MGFEGGGVTMDRPGGGKVMAEEKSAKIKPIIINNNLTPFSNVSFGIPTL